MYGENLKLCKQCHFGSVPEQQNCDWLSQLVVVFYTIKLLCSGTRYGTIYDMIYWLIEIWLPPGDTSTIHIYTQTIHRTTQNKQYIDQHKNFGRMQTVPRPGELYPGICLTKISVALVRERTIPTERPPPVGEVSANFCG